MQNDTPPPADTIELLLREISAQLRRRAADNPPSRRSSSLLALAAVALCACGPTAEPAPPARGPGIVQTPPPPFAGMSAEEKRADALEITRSRHQRKVYVQRVTGCHDDHHDSTLSDPYCEIAPALPASGPVL